MLYSVKQPYGDVPESFCSRSRRDRRGRLDARARSPRRRFRGAGRRARARRVGRGRTCPERYTFRSGPSSPGSRRGPGQVARSSLLRDRNRSAFAAKRSRSSDTSTSSPSRAASPTGRETEIRSRFSSRWTKSQAATYSRHLLIPEVGEEGQLKLLQSRVLLIGAGGSAPPHRSTSQPPASERSASSTTTRRRHEPAAPDRAFRPSGSASRRPSPRSGRSRR